MAASGAALLIHFSSRLMSPALCHLCSGSLFRQPSITCANAGVTLARNVEIGSGSFSKDRRRHRQLRFAFKCALARHHLVEHRPESEDVAACIRFPAFALLL